MYNIVMITGGVGDIYTTDKEHVTAFLEQLQGGQKGQVSAIGIQI